MSLKKFKEMYELDIKKYVQLKPTFKKVGGKLEKLPEKYHLDYLEWATVLFLLYENGADLVKFGCYSNNDGYPAFYFNGKNPFVKIWVDIDGCKYDYEYPVINGNKVQETPTQLIVHNAQQRAFAKCVAVNTGLGLKLWQKEEQKFDNIPDEKKSERKKIKFPAEKFNDAVKFLKEGKTITELEQYYIIEEEMKTKLFNASI